MCETSENSPLSRAWSGLYILHNKFDSVGIIHDYRRGPHERSRVAEGTGPSTPQQPVGGPASNGPPAMVLTPARLAGEDQTRVPQHTLSISSLHAPSRIGVGGSLIPRLGHPSFRCARHEPDEVGTTVATLDFSTGLKCRVCGKLYPKDADQLLHRRLRPARSRLRLRGRSPETSSRAKIEKRPQNMWRYRELLPHRRRADRRPAGRRHAAGPGRPPGRRAGRRAACGSRTTRSTSRRCRSRTASSRWP